MTENDHTTNEDLTLLAVLSQCFEVDEMIDGYHLRTAPFGSETVAVARFAQWKSEIEHWLGPREGEDAGGDGEDWQRAWWPDLRMKRTGRGIAFWVRSARVERWWHDTELWEDPGLDGLWQWEV